MPGSNGAALDTFLQDLRLTTRTLGRNRGFAVVTILTLALGIGATTAVFSTVNAALIRGVPFPEGDRLVIGEKIISGRASRWVSKPDYFDFREMSRSFEELAAVTDFVQQRTVTGGPEPWIAKAGFCTWNLFRTLRVRPAVGRTFLRAEETGEGQPVVVLSHALWQGRFGRSPGIVGSTINLDRVAFTVVGVMPHNFSFLNDADLRHLAGRTGGIDLVRDSHSHCVIGRLKAGVSLQQAQHDVDAIAHGLELRYPDTNKDKGLRLAGLQDFMVREVRGTLVLLMATTGGLLLIGCANVAGLLLARGHRRLSEMVTRSALGASRGRLVRQLLTESVVLTLVAGMLGIGATHVFLSLLMEVFVLSGLDLAPPAIDGSVLLFALAVSIVTGVVVGIVPALRGASVSPSSQLGRGKQALEHARSSRLRSSLVVVQVAVSVVLLVGSGLLTRSLVKLATVSLGFELAGVLTARIPIQHAAYRLPSQRAAFFSSVLAEVEALPGVESASLIDKVPLLNRWTDWYVWRAGEPRPTGPESFTAMARWAYPEYFATLRVPLLRGRDISATDTHESRGVIVLSESLARRLFRDGDPIGQQVSIWNIERPFAVVGIVGDVRLNLLTASDPAMYMAAAQAGHAEMRLTVRTSGDPAQIAGSNRHVLRTKDRNVPLGEVATLASIVGDELSLYRVTILTLGLFSTMALVLTTMGLYGALAYHVSQQEREMGVRMALGAGRAGLVGHVLGRGMLLVGVGVVVGIAGSVPATGLLRALLFDTTPHDPSTVAASVGLLTCVTAVACLLPAWRATRVNPVDVLRSE